METAEQRWLFSLLCLYSLSLAAKLNFNISKVVYYKGQCTNQNSRQIHLPDAKHGKTRQRLRKQRIQNKLNLSFTTNFTVAEIRSVHLFVSELAQAKYVTTAFNSKLKYDKLAAVVRAQNLVISRCWFAKDGREMYKDLQRTCSAIVLPIKPFILWRSRCRRGFLFSHWFYVSPNEIQRKKIDLDNMDFFFISFQTFQFAAILVHHSHQSSLDLQLVVT